MLYGQIESLVLIQCRIHSVGKDPGMRRIRIVRIHFMIQLYISHWNLYNSGFRQWIQFYAFHIKRISQCWYNRDSGSGIDKCLPIDGNESQIILKLLFKTWIILKNFRLLESRLQIRSISNENRMESSSNYHIQNSKKSKIQIHIIFKNRLPPRKHGQAAPGTNFE